MRQEASKVTLTDMYPIGITLLKVVGVVFILGMFIYILYYY